MVSRFFPSSAVSKTISHKKKILPQVAVSEYLHSYIEMIAIGGFSPLEGFLNENDYRSVLSEMRLSTGILWPLPIVCRVDKKMGGNLEKGSQIALTLGKRVIGQLFVESIFESDLKADAKKIFGTDDVRHPGVLRFLHEGGIFVGGKIEAFVLPLHSEFSKYNLTPIATRHYFQKQGWTTIVGFQTRNPMHRGHEYITKAALEIVDGLHLHPLVGFTKWGDVPPLVRMKSYESLLNKYYSKRRVLLSINPSPMFYAGPREAVLHAIVRQNYGCTHFIVGRDHAGVGKFYGEENAQKMVNSFSRKDLGIQPLCFDNVFWCKRNNAVATSKTSNSRINERISLSGTEIRSLISRGKRPPLECMRPEVSKILIDWSRNERNKN